MMQQSVHLNSPRPLAMQLGTMQQQHKAAGRQTLEHPAAACVGPPQLPETTKGAAQVAADTSSLGAATPAADLAQTSAPTAAGAAASDVALGLSGVTKARLIGTKPGRSRLKPPRPFGSAATPLHASTATNSRLAADDGSLQLTTARQQMLGSLFHIEGHRNKGAAAAAAAATGQALDALPDGWLALSAAGQVQPSTRQVQPSAGKTIKLHLKGQTRNRDLAADPMGNHIAAVSDEGEQDQPRFQIHLKGAAMNGNPVEDAACKQPAADIKQPFRIRMKGAGQRSMVTPGAASCAAEPYTRVQQTLYGASAASVPTAPQLMALPYETNHKADEHQVPAGPAARWASSFMAAAKNKRRVARTTTPRDAIDGADVAAAAAAADGPDTAAALHKGCRHAAAADIDVLGYEFGHTHGPFGLYETATHTADAYLDTPREDPTGEPDVPQHRRLQRRLAHQNFSPLLAASAGQMAAAVAGAMNTTAGQLHRSDMMVGSASTSAAANMQQASSAAGITKVRQFAQVLQPKSGGPAMVHQTANKQYARQHKADADLAQQAASTPWEAATLATYYGIKPDSDELLPQLAQGVRELERSQVATIESIYAEADSLARQHGLALVILKPYLLHGDHPYIMQTAALAPMARSVQLQSVGGPATAANATTNALAPAMATQACPAGANISPYVVPGSTHTYVTVKLKRRARLAEDENYRIACEQMYPECRQECMLHLVAILKWWKSPRSKHPAEWGPLMRQIEPRVVPAGLARRPLVKHTGISKQVKEQCKAV